MEPALWLSSFLRGSESARSQQQPVSWRKLLACFLPAQNWALGLLRLVMFVILFLVLHPAEKGCSLWAFISWISRMKWSWTYYQSYSKMGYDTSGYLHPENKRTWSIWLVQSSNLQVDVDCLTLDVGYQKKKKNGNPEFCHSIKIMVKITKAIRTDILGNLETDSRFSATWGVLIQEKQLILSNNSMFHGVLICFSFIPILQQRITLKISAHVPNTRRSRMDYIYKEFILHS